MSKANPWDELDSAEPDTGNRSAVLSAMVEELVQVMLRKGFSWKEIVACVPAVVGAIALEEREVIHFLGGLHGIMRVYRARAPQAAVLFMAKLNSDFRH